MLFNDNMSNKSKIKIPLTHKNHCQNVMKKNGFRCTFRSHKSCLIARKWYPALIKISTRGQPGVPVPTGDGVPYG